MTDDRSGRARRSAPALGVPIGFPDDRDRYEVTDPLDLWTRSVYTEAERRVIDALGQDPDKPVPLGQLVKITVQLAEEKQRRLKSDTDRQRTQATIADQVLAVHAAISPDHLAEMDRRLSAAERWRKSVNKIVLATVLAAAGSLGGLGAMLWHRATQEGGDAVRLERVQHDIEHSSERIDRLDERLRHDVDQLRQELGRRSSTPVSSAELALKGSP